MSNHYHTTAQHIAELAAESIDTLDTIFIRCVTASNAHCSDVKYDRYCISVCVYEFLLNLLTSLSDVCC